METARRDLHTQTAHISSLLTQYSKLAAQASSSYSASGKLKDDLGRRKEELETELNGAMDTFEAQIERLANLHATALPPPSTSATHALERHREVLQEYQKDYQRNKTSLREAEQRANLLGSVRDEIRDFKSASASNSATDSLLADRSRIDSSHRQVDEILGTAYETRQAFSQQRNAISGMNSRMGGVLSSVPAINSILTMISARRSRDSLIMGSVIGFCTVVMLWYKFG